MLLTIDMGNSNIEVGLMKDDDVVFSERISTDHNKTAGEYAVLLHTIFEIAGYTAEDIDGAIISSVVPPLTRKLRDAVKTVTRKVPLIVEPGTKTGLKMKVEDPRIVGADLIVDSVAAIKLYGKPCLVIDMGTATTIMAVDKDGNFIGGAILPGIMTSLNALSSNASKLPSIDLTAPKKVINSGTTEAMQSGIVFGQASLIDGMIDRMNRELGYETTVVATGGLAKMIVPYCQHNIILDNALMLKGLKFIYDKNRHE